MTRTDSIINANKLHQTVDDFSAFSALTNFFCMFFLSLSHSPTYILYVYLQKLWESIIICRCGITFDNDCRSTRYSLSDRWYLGSASISLKWIMSLLAGISLYHPIHTKGRYWFEPVRLGPQQHLALRWELDVILKRSWRTWRLEDIAVMSATAVTVVTNTFKHPNISVFSFILFLKNYLKISVFLSPPCIVMCLLAYLEHNLAVAQPIGCNQPRGIIVSLSPVTVAGPLMTNCSATGSSRGVITIAGHAFEAMVTQPVSSEWYILSCILHWLYVRGYVCGLIWSLQPLKARAQCPQ